MSKPALALQRGSEYGQKVYRYCFISWLFKLGGNSFLAFYCSVNGSNRGNERCSICLEIYIFPSVQRWMNLELGLEVVQ